MLGWGGDDRKGEGEEIEEMRDCGSQTHRMLGAGNFPGRLQLAETTTLVCGKEW